jgi:hypothetical protein
MATRIPIMAPVNPVSAQGRPGRHFKLADPQRRETLLEALTAGNTRKAACACAGFSEDAFARYCTAYPNFAEAVREAEATAEIRNVGKIQQASEKNWRAAAWWLERRHPQEWGRKNQTIQTGADGGQIAVQEIPFDLTKLTDHEYEVFKTLVAKIDTGPVAQKLKRVPLLLRVANEDLRSDSGPAQRRED